MKSYYDNLKKWSPETENLLKRVQRVIHSVVPDAEIIFYGSRARGDSGSNSDWDFLILVDQPLDSNRITELKDRLYDLELMTNTVLTSIVRRREEWNSPKYSVLPFKHEVEREGIQL